MGSQALGHKDSGHMATERMRQKEIEDMDKKIAANKIVARKAGIGSVTEHLKAAHAGGELAEHMLFDYYDVSMQQLFFLCLSLRFHHSVGSPPNCLDKGLPLRTWRLRGLCAEICGPHRDKFDRVAALTAWLFSLSFVR